MIQLACDPYRSFKILPSYGRFVEPLPRNTAPVSRLNQINIEHEFNYCFIFGRTSLPVSNFNQLLLATILDQFGWFSGPFSYSMLNVEYVRFENWFDINNMSKSIWVIIVCVSVCWFVWFQIISSSCKRRVYPVAGNWMFGGQPNFGLVIWFSIWRMGALIAVVVFIHPHSSSSSPSATSYTLLPPPSPLSSSLHLSPPPPPPPPHSTPATFLLSFIYSLF